MNLRDNEEQYSAPARPKLTGVLSVSVALHLLIGFLLFREYQTERESVATPPAPIQAKLVFVDLPPIPTQAPESEPIPSEIVEPTTPDMDTQPDIDTRAEVPAEQSQPIEPPATAATQNQQREDLPPIVAQPKTAEENPINLRSLAKQHLQGIEAQRQQDFVAGQAGAFRQQQISPELRGEPVDPFITEDEKLLESMQVNVDCSSSAAKTVAVLSMFTGGALRCTDGPSVTPYIQNRLNKGVAIDKESHSALDSQTK